MFWPFSLIFTKQPPVHTCAKPNFRYTQPGKYDESKAPAAAKRADDLAEAKKRAAVRRAGIRPQSSGIARIGGQR